MEQKIKTIRNALRNSFFNSVFFKNNMWNEIYPILICKLNAQISNLGVNRECVSQNEMVERVLPVLSVISLFGAQEEKFLNITKAFRDSMGRFMNKRRNNKSRKIEQKKFILHEMVMRKSYSEGDIEYVGPYRVINISPQGINIRELKTGVTMS